jgi:hypothetical protein
LAQRLSGRAADYFQGLSFEPAGPSGSVAEKLDAVRLERSRCFRGAWLGWCLGRALKLGVRFDVFKDNFQPAP